MKRCFECEVTKPRTAFYSHPGMADGLMGVCKDCHKARMKVNRRDNPLVQARDRVRARTPKRKTHIAKVTARWIKQHPELAEAFRRKNPEAYRARNAVNNALARGKIKKLPCEVCGSEESQAHHEDYSRPLDVTWLCPQHHADLHPKWHRPVLIEVRHG